MSGLDFAGVYQGENQADLAKKGDFTILPEGWHVGHITSCQVLENKKKTGKFLEIVLNTPDGVEVTDRLNLWHPTEKVVQIAKGSLARMGEAWGLDIQTLTSDDLPGREIGFRVKVQEFKSNKDGKVLQSNSVTSYRSPALGVDHANAPPPVSQDPGPGNTPPHVNTEQVPGW